MTEPISVDDLKSIPEYEEQRVAVRRRIIALKKIRRLILGDRVSLVFDNRETLLFQIHEMMRAEGITDRDALQAECDVYNGLLPNGSELTAALFIELPPGSDVRGELKSFIGIDEHTALVLGDESIVAKSEEGYFAEERISTIQYIRFSLDGPQLERFRETSVAAAVVIDHPNYQARLTLSEETRRSLIEDLS
ncbi:MAG: DUF3501 family protein [Myxococcota bacterium]